MEDFNVAAPTVRADTIDRVRVRVRDKSRADDLAKIKAALRAELLGELRAELRAMIREELDAVLGSVRLSVDSGDPAQRPAGRPGRELTAWPEVPVPGSRGRPRRLEYEYAEAIRDAGGPVHTGDVSADTGKSQTSLDNTCKDAVERGDFLKVTDAARTYDLSPSGHYAKWSK